MEELLSITVPFEGFYESSHSFVFDRYLEQEQEYLKEEYALTEEQIQELGELFYWNIDWKKAYDIYAKEYVSCLEDLIEGEGKETITLQYTDLDSPKEYNFTTDRIFAKISPVDVQKMFDRVDRKTLNESIEARFTSYDGFISFYPNSLSEWPANVLEWDHNQLGCLLEAYLQVILETDNIYEELESYSLMEPSLCNGFIEQVVWECAGAKFKDYYNNLTAEKVEKTDD